MTSDKPTISKKVLLAISGALCLLFLTAALSNLLSTQTIRVSRDYQLLIYLGTAFNMIGGSAGLISIALSYKASRSPLFRVSAPLISVVLIPDLITIYLSKISHPSNLAGLISTLFILFFIYFSIMWNSKPSGQASISDSDLIEK